MHDRLYPSMPMPLPRLRLPASPPRRRPPELAYAASERPPAGPLLSLFDVERSWGGVPVLYLYVFGVWAVLIGLMAWIIER